VSAKEDDGQAVQHCFRPRAAKIDLNHRKDHAEHKIVAPGLRQPRNAQLEAVIELFSQHCFRDAQCMVGRFACVLDISRRNTIRLTSLRARRNASRHRRASRSRIRSTDQFPGELRVDANPYPSVRRSCFAEAVEIG